MNHSELTWAATTLAAAMIGVHGADDKAIATKAIDLALEIERQVTPVIQKVHSEAFAAAQDAAAIQAALAAIQDAQPLEGQEALPATAGAALDPPIIDAQGYHLSLHRVTNEQ